MVMRRVNLLLLLALVVSIGLNWVLRANPAQTNFQFLPEMVHSVAYDAFSSNPVFADGKTLQQPVAGTIAQGYLPLRYGVTPEEARRAGEELTNPFSEADARALERGAAVFTNFCQACHGPAGIGNGPVALRGFPAPASLVAERAVNMKDGQIFHVITYGQGNMPSHATQLSREDRWKVILHLRSLQKPAATAPR